MGLSAIQKAFQDCVVAATGYADDHVIWLYPNAPRPTLPYIGLHLLSMVKMGGDYFSKPDNLGKRRIYSDYYINLNITCFFTGDGSKINGFDILNDMRQKFRTEAIVAILDTNKISLIKELSNIVFIPSLIATGFEQRAMIDIQFGIGTSIEEMLYIIEKVDGKGTIKTNGTDLEIDYKSEA